ncbi:similar to Saccharomyces cerevisiae YGL203C KEX1 Protease involved in the processing of killer toxin and alpha factor precursor [Maudiozyma barnettii]|uniref:Carboxypeptidase n=1 Tax=Maudiozyma barnettii TaxID=61262 RepID=A0A8H2ZHC5_9SACH|nr:serine-type carboxypeptidase [Kazachstania barnettii]CAB4251994.1 similar to Saccharomyces cerevisiae YGL203C KEX1 Protease involved in the processing of killer toxin and alpha factor precursor [Kazachstania barnettii]CAD1778407.1 similar to Saccharomyces cerevisiae YGL203C KEX1 Protease involved in the processing of killer toxin and alpha factor precursor [Kazachstania barnettii]
MRLTLRSAYFWIYLSTAIVAHALIIPQDYVSQKNTLLLGRDHEDDDDDDDETLDSDSFEVDYKQIPGLSKLTDFKSIPEMYAGHIPLFGWDTEDKEVPEDFGYFFWRFHDKSLPWEDDDDYDDDDDDEENDNNEMGTLIFWLNGGPGCSSMDGALVESGPLRIDAKGNAYLNQNSWASRADMVFVDQPAGTGFSATKGDSNGNNIPLDDNLEDVALHFCQFLINYFQVFPQDIHKKIILAGESYAGQYIPHIATAIVNFEQYPELKNNMPHFDLAALLIGNGWIDPVTQSLAYLPFAIDNNLINKDTPGFNNLLNTHENCQKKINTKDGNNDEQFSIPECDNIINELISVTKTTDDDNNEQCLNVYNYELKDSMPACGMNWPADVSYVAQFFGDKKVRDALHINEEWAAENWIECRKDVMNHMSNKGSKPSIQLLPDLLESGLNVVLFNGDKDLICNNRGITDMIKSMKWGDQLGFSEDAENYDWIFRSQLKRDTDTAAGYVIYDRNLTFISVYNSSHMVPHDKPVISSGIVDIILDNVLLESIGKRQVLVSSEKPYNEDFFDDEDNDETEEDNEKPEKSKENDDDKEEDSHRYYYYYYYDQEEDYDDDDDDAMIRVDGYESHKGLIFTAFFIVLFIGIIAIRTIDRWLPKVTSQFGGAYSRLENNPNKTVTWADEANPQMNFELDDMNAEENFEIGDTDEEDGHESSRENGSDSNSDVSELDIGELSASPVHMEEQQILRSS